MVKYPNVVVPLSEINGNIFNIISKCRSMMRAAGVPDDEIKTFSDEVRKAQSYDAALQVVMRWVDWE